MQKSAVVGLMQGEFKGQLDEAWQILKHQAHVNDQRPAVNFSAEALPAYYHSEVSKLTFESNGQYTLKTSVASLSGNEGSLPRAMNNQALKAKFELGDEAPLDFFDMFNNRYYRLYCETKQKHQLAYQMEEDTFHWNNHRQSITQILSSLAGQTEEKAPIPESHLVKYMGLLGLNMTCPLTLKTILEDYFKAQFEVEHSGLEYLPLTPCSLTQLGQSGNNQQLGMGALIGKSAPMFGQQLNIKICPKDYQHYLKLQSDSQIIHALDYMVRSYMGVNTKCELYMKVNSQYLPRLKLSISDKNSLRIGQSAWMSTQTNSQQFVEIPMTKS